MYTISAVLTSYCVSDVVSNFDGKPTYFREWIRAVEKYQRLTNLGVDQCKLLVFQTSRDPVRDVLITIQIVCGLN